MVAGKSDVDDNTLYSKNRINTVVLGRDFPVYIAWWSHNTFRKVGYDLLMASVLSVEGPAVGAVGLNNPVGFARRIRARFRWSKRKRKRTRNYLNRRRQKIAWVS
jgi:hypothetical protein